jgi:hypothetical protein
MSLLLGFGFFLGICVLACAVVAAVIGLYYLGKVIHQWWLAGPYQDKFFLHSFAADYGRQLKADQKLTQLQKNQLRSALQAVERIKIYLAGEVLHNERKDIDRRGIRTTRSRHRVLLRYRRNRFFVCEVICSGRQHDQKAHPEVSWMTESPSQFSPRERDEICNRLSRAEEKASTMSLNLAATAAFWAVFVVIVSVLIILLEFWSSRELSKLPFWQILIALALAVVPALCVSTWFFLRARRLKTLRIRYVY